MLKDRFLTVLACIFTVLLILTFSISLPIYIRPFYYMQIDSLNVTEVTGLDKQTVKSAYDQVLDYLTLPNKEFGTGVFSYSESGKSHFEDCKYLFNLNITVLTVSLAGIIILSILRRKNFFRPVRPFGKHYSFTCGSALLIFFILLISTIAVDFENAFLIFHKIFFFGKENWVFNRATDPIIKILPMNFFLNCAVLIISSIVIISCILIFFGIFEGKNTAPNNKK